MFRALRWVGEEADENMQRKAGPGKETWDLYCTCTGALQEALKLTAQALCERLKMILIHPIMIQNQGFPPTLPGPSFLCWTPDSLGGCLWKTLSATVTLILCSLGYLFGVSVVSVISGYFRKSLALGSGYFNKQNNSGNKVEEWFPT